MLQSRQAANRAAIESEEFLRMPSVLKWTGLARSTIYQLIAHKQFPAQVRLAERAVGWRRSDLARWSANRRTTDQRQELRAPDSSAVIRAKSKGHQAAREESI